jgi:hypothetical protein
MATDGERRAITKALLLGGAAAVRRVRYGVYAVASASRPGVAHTVTVAAGAYRCDCEAGVFVAKVEHAGGARVTGPGRRPAALSRERRQDQKRGETAATVAPVAPVPLPAAA